MFAQPQMDSSADNSQPHAPTPSQSLCEKKGSFAPLHNTSFDSGSVVYLSCACESARLTGKRLQFSVQGVQKEIELHMVRRIVMLGRPKLSSHEQYRLMRQGVGIDFLDVFGRPQGVMSPLTDYFNPAQRFQESFHAQSSSRLDLARRIISSKILNSCWVVHRRTGVPEALQACARQAAEAQDFASLRGVEGYAARVYFGLWSAMTGDCGFSTRKAYPAPDPVNALLSFGYGLLHNRLSAVLARHGFQARMGFFHVGRGRHCALASDLMEDMRACVDSLVLRLTGLRQVRPEHFRLRNGRCMIQARDTLRLFLTEFETMMTKPFASPCTRPDILRGEVTDMNNWLDSTARAYLAHIRGEMEYSPLCRR